jgi:ABC-type sulfate transport system substrate-binding protein
VGGKPEWGFVKLGHTDPTRSNSGLQALYLMTLEYYGKSTIDVGDLLDPKYQAFVKQTEHAVTSFEPSTGTFMTEMVRFGPSKYDVALVYENLAVAQLEAAQGRWGNLRVYYPHATIWSDHPAAVLQAEWVTPEQKAAAHTWLTYLRSRPVQEHALNYGFRPGDTNVPVRTADPQNPFTRLAGYGVKVDVPGAARAPDGAVVRNLVVMWNRTCAPQGGMR